MATNSNVDQSFPTTSMEIPIMIQIKMMVLFLTLRGTPLPDLKLWIMGPKNLWFNNQSWNRGEELAKHAAANNMNGVVGSNGNYT